MTRPSALTAAQFIILERMSDMPKEYWQREDGLRCEPGVIQLSGWRYAWTLWRLRRLRLIEREKFYSGRRWLWAYRPTNAGRAALEGPEGERK
jgi:hypothetical protein